MKKKNFFDDIPGSHTEEVTEIITENENVRIERITSTGQASPEGFWYEQDEDEFVLLQAGSAVIKFFDGSETALSPGDYINIPAGKKHRVEKTDPDVPTLWLTVFSK